MTSTKKGVLYVIPSWLSEDTPAAAVVPASALERLRALERFVVENARGVNDAANRRFHVREDFAQSRFVGDVGLDVVFASLDR